MPNGIKYATTIQSGSLKKDNVAIGIGNVGPTSTTSFYSMPTPASGKYVINKVASSGVPNFFFPQDEAEMIKLARQEGATGADTASLAACLYWFATQPNYAPMNSPYPEIVTNGIQIFADASVTTWYPTTGSYCFNCGETGSTGVLFNGISWANYSVGGAFLLDGVDDAILLSYSGNEFQFLNQPFSLCVWVNKTQTDPGGPVISRGIFQGGGRWEFGFTNGTQTYFVTSLNSTSTTQYSNSNIISNNTWYYIVSTFDSNGNCKLYCNGTDVTSTPVSMVTPNNNAYPVCYNIGMYNCFSGGYKVFFKGYWAHHAAYNRVLSAAEILQNFNATKARFGY